MQSRLIVKNFGPIEFVDLDLRNVNVFIGPQASGKSALAKLFTIFKAPRKFLRSAEGVDSITLITDTTFSEVLTEYNILSFLKHNTEIEFLSELHDLSFKENIITYKPKLLKRINHIEGLKINFEENVEEIKKELKRLYKSFFQFKYKSGKIFEKLDNVPLFPRIDKLDEYASFQNLKEETFSLIVKDIKDIELHLSTNAALYIPSERNFINIIKKSSLNLILNNVPIPKHILAFGAELEKATVEEIDLNFLQKNLIYKRINNEDKIFTNEDNSIQLSEAASGIQSVLPILIPIYSRTLFSSQQSFVIEEAELNLFPTAQYELIKLLEKNRNDPGRYEDIGSIHTYTTHSPYILSAINNLLFGNKIFKLHIESNTQDEDQEIKWFDLYDKVTDIISTTINPDYFTAYQISNGGAVSIFNRESGLIEDNYIDQASDKMSEDFDALMELMK